MFNRKKVFPVIPLLLFCITAGACKNTVETSSEGITLTPPEISTESYNFAEVTNGQILSEYTYSNCELYCQDSTTVTSGISGEIVSVSYAYNQKINSGDILMTVNISVSDIEIAEREVAYEQDYRAYLAGRKEMEQEIEACKAIVEALPENSYERIKQQNILDKMTEELSSYIENRTASLSSAKSSIESLKASEGINYIYAPCSGFLSEVTPKRAGDTINYGETVATIVSPYDTFIRVADNRAQLKYGMKVTISNNFSDNFLISGTVVSAADVLPDNLWTGYAYVRPDENLGTDTWTGYTVKATLRDISNICITDSKALYNDEDRRYVLIYNDGVTTKQYVNFAMSNSGSSWILNGVEVGQQLIMKTTGRR